MTSVAQESSRILGTWDYVAIIGYFVLILCVGFWSLFRVNRGTVSGYFLAGRNMLWLPVGASLFASNIGSEHFVGLAGSGAAAGLGVAAFEFKAILTLQLLAWIFLPVYIASGVYTLPEYLQRRFGGQRVRVLLAVLSLLMYIFTKISVDLYSGALFIQETLQWNLYLSIFLLLFITAVCTITGGLAAVIYTDTLQFFIMIIGAVILSVMSFIKVGGYQALRVKYMDAIPDETRNNLTGTCGLPRDDSWQMLRDPWHSDMPWVGFMLGQSVTSIWYWCGDQLMAQRVLSAKSLSHAQGGCIFTGYIKLLPMFIMVLPGMISRVFFPNEVACASAETCMKVCGSSTGCSNLAYPKLVLHVMPTGMKGIMLAVMLAALVTDLTSIFNSTSTLFTIDIWKHFRAKLTKKEPTVRELMIVGRMVVCVLVVTSILWIPVIQRMQGGQLFIYIQEISSYLSPPIAAIFLIAVLWPRANEQGCFWGLMAGFLVGGMRMFLDFIWRPPRCWEEDLRPALTSKLHYMYFALILFVVTAVADVIVSLLTAPPPKRRLIRTTYWTRFDSTSREDDFEDVKDEVELEDTGAGIEDGHVTEVTAATDNPCRRGCDWFCGFDDTVKGQEQKEKHEEHLRSITSLKQDPRARVFIFINLIILVSVVVGVYTVFSIPNTKITSIYA